MQDWKRKVVRMHVAFGRVRRKSRIVGGFSTDAAEIGECAMNRTTTNGIIEEVYNREIRSYKIRCRDREIAPTEEPVGFYQIRGRDREIAPTEEGWVSHQIRGRDREIAPTEEGWVVYQIRESRSGDRSYRRGVGFI